MGEHHRLNPKDVYTPDNFLRDRMLDYEQLPEMPRHRPPVGVEFMLGVAIGMLIMLPVYTLVVVVWWWLSR